MYYSATGGNHELVALLIALDMHVFGKYANQNNQDDAKRRKRKICECLGLWNLARILGMAARIEFSRQKKLKTSPMQSLLSYFVSRLSASGRNDLSDVAPQSQ